MPDDTIDRAFPRVRHSHLTQLQPHSLGQDVIRDEYPSQVYLPTNAPYIPNIPYVGILAPMQPVPRPDETKLVCVWTELAGRLIRRGVCVGWSWTVVIHAAYIASICRDQMERNNWTLWSGLSPCIPAYIRRNGSLHPPLGVTVPGCMHSDRTIREIKFRFQMLAFEGKKEWSWRDG